MYQTTILTETMDLIAARGMDRASIRSVGAALDRAPSSITKHFGGRDALIASTFDSARHLDKEWRETLLGDLPPTIASDGLARLIHAVVHQDAVGRRQLHLVRWECFTASEVNGSFVEITTHWSTDHVAFWRRLLDRFRLGGGAELCAEFADGAGRLYANGPLPSAFALAGEACARFAARLLSIPPQLGEHAWLCAIRSDGAAASDARVSRRSETAERILGHTIDIIIEQGPSSATHRAIAAKGGISLSSMTHHFESRAEILREAYRRLSTTWIARARVPAADAGTRLTREGVIGRMIEGMLADDARISPEQLALQRIQLAAGRDATLAADMSQLRAAAGQATVALVNCEPGLRGRIDELDGFCFANWVTGMARSARMQPPPDRRDYLRRRYEDAFRLLFDGKKE